MSRIRTAAVATAALFLVGCGQAPQLPVADGQPVPAEVIEFDPQAWGRARLAALATEPVQLRVFAGWYGRAERDDTSGVDRVVPEPGRSLLAVAGDSGCRLSTGVAVRRVGDDLRVDFTGGTASQTCTRPYGPVALLSVPTDAVDGVRTVDGAAPVAASGPGVLTGFVQLQSGPPTAVEIGHGDAALIERVQRNPDARAALTRPAHPGTRAFAFVLTGCRETGAVLLLGDHLIAEPAGGEGVTCYLPEFYLAVFELPAGLVPEPLVLGD
jgi:hypothetical protein